MLLLALALALVPSPGRLCWASLGFVRMACQMESDI